MKTIREIADSQELLEIGRAAIEKSLIGCRELRLSEFTRGNGLVIKEADGKDSHVIRMGPEHALRIGLRAIAKHLEGLAKI